MSNFPSGNWPNVTGLTIQILQDATSNFFGRLNHLTYCGDVRMNRYLARAIPETVKDCFLFFQSSFMPDPFITQKRTLNLHSFVISISSQFPLFYDIHFFLSVKKVPVDGAILCIQNKNNNSWGNIRTSNHNRNDRLRSWGGEQTRFHSDCSVPMMIPCLFLCQSSFNSFYSGLGSAKITGFQTIEVLLSI